MPPTEPDVFGNTKRPVEFAVVVLLERAGVVVAAGGLVRAGVVAGGWVAAELVLVEAGTVVAGRLFVVAAAGGCVVIGAARAELLLADGARGAAEAGVGPGVMAEANWLVAACGAELWVGSGRAGVGWAGAGVTGRVCAGAGTVRSWRGKLSKTEWVVRLLAEPERMVRPNEVSRKKPPATMVMRASASAAPRPLISAPELPPPMPSAPPSDRCSSTRPIKQTQTSR